MINTRTLYAQYANACGLSQSSRLETAFIMSVNRALLVLESDCSLASTQLTAISDNVELDPKYGDILLDGIRFFIQEFGEWTKETDPDLSRKWLMAQGKARRRYMDDNPTWDGAHGDRLSDE